MAEDTYCPNCDANHYGGNYCGKCGVVLIPVSASVKCTHCGADLAYDDNYCRWCGIKTDIA
mgnify:FL=1